MIRHHDIQPDTPIAIIGMGCFFPKASGLKEYRRLLFLGEDAITEVPETHWRAEDYYDKNPATPDHVYCKRGGFLSPVSFDPTEFGIPPSAIEATDTSQLLSLLAAKKAIQDAGYEDGRKPLDRSRVSVILGVTGTQELVIPLGARLGHPIWRKALNDVGVPPNLAEDVIKRIADGYVSWQENSFPGLLGNVVAGRICNRLNFGGTNCVVDAACASSMSAIHVALLELQTRRADMVITGGADAINDIFMYSCFAKTLILSHTGDARPFSKHADGTVLGEGIGILVLKRLEDAQKDQDRIYAVIRGIGSSSDGKSQSIYAPRAEGQAKALKTAYEQAGIDPATVELIEAHGTGTKVGDAVEFKALTQVFGASERNGRRCAIGSVKSNIGHTKAAAGAAGLIKAVLSLYHKVLPPTLKAEQPDPNLNIENSPFYISTQIRPWFSENGHPRRAGVSAFGFGGSNFHAVVEEYQKNKPEITWDGTADIVALSASCREELEALLSDWKAELDRGISVSELAAKSFHSRQTFAPHAPHRLLILLDRADDSQKHSERFSEALNLVRQKVEGKRQNAIFYSDQLLARPKIAFVFPGQGSQYVGMGRDLVCAFPQGFELMEIANQTVQTADRLTNYIYPYPALSDEQKQIQEATLRQTDIAQPAIGAVSMAMLKILEYFGIQPDAVCGHSFGELTALCAANRIDTHTFFKLAQIRGQLMASAGRNKGAMLAVLAPIHQIERLIHESQFDVILANRNSLEQGVLSGSIQEIKKMESLCSQKGIRTRRLPVSAAFHSPLIEDACQPFADALQLIEIRHSQIPVYSNTTGMTYPSDPEQTKQLLARHLREPVNFAQEIENLYQAGIRIFIEVGPKSVLTELIQSILTGREFSAMALDRNGTTSGMQRLAMVVCSLAVSGYPVELKQWETDAPEVRKQKMSIMISGANYRVKREVKKVKGVNQIMKTARPDQMPVIGGIKAAMTPVPANNKGRSMESGSQTPELKIRNQELRIMNQPTEFIGNSQFLIPNYLNAIQEGLKSMQSLQMQTADAHKKFLESQTEASRTLQQMMEQTRRLAEISMGMPVSDIQRYEPVQPLEKKSEIVQPPMEPKMEPTKILSSTAIQPVTKEVNKVNEVQEVKAIKTLDTVKPEASLSQTDLPLTSTLISVVSELTGYPMEMLSLDMDIEADLGIDSIKRVEILSKLEERLPGLPQISPDRMGTLKTLRQIVTYLSTKDNRESTKDNKEVQPDAAPSQTNMPITSTLIAVVSELTGYPTDMLSLDMDIEADLGIDSIKRVEILSKLEERLPGLPQISPDRMGTLKTLGQIVNYLSASNSPSDSSANSLALEKGRHGELVEKKTIHLIEQPLTAGNSILISSGKTIYVTDDHTGLSGAIVDEFRSRHREAVLTELSFQPSALISQPSAAGLVIVVSPHEGANGDDAFLKQAFALTQGMASEMIRSAKEGGAVLASVSRMDGAFGFKGNGMANPLQGGLAGLIKTAAIEWEGVCCHALDIAPDWQDHSAMAKAVVDEVLHSRDIEVGLEPGKRRILKLESAPYPTGTIRLSSEDVVVITGGARGVTAEAAIALAKEVRSTMILIGRSPHPIPEPLWLTSAADDAAMKKAIVEHERPASPVELEKSFKRHKANREIAATLSRLRSAGSKAFYYPADIRDTETVRQILEQVRTVYGPIKAVIHGAGTLEDRLIADKTPEQFNKVFDTKVKGLNGLLQATKSDALHYIILFSSVTARMGNKGQADYAMANEVLNKTAQNEAAVRPDCRVISINWGPWDGGMVADSVKREFLRNGIDLIPLEAGARSMVEEMRGTNRLPVEVVMGSCFNSSPPSVPAPSLYGTDLEKKDGEDEPLTPIFKREISVEQFPILAAHILNGKPVVPFALMTEWMCQSALHDNPGLLLHRLEDIRLLHGIKIGHDNMPVQLMTGKPQKSTLGSGNGVFYEVPVEIRNGRKPIHQVIHTRAKAVLTSRLPPSPEFRVEFPINSYSRSMDEVYETILFHGAELRGIRDILTCTPELMIARLKGAPHPSAWMIDPLRSRWVSDPLVLDCAFQMAIVWCYEHQGMASLPSYAASYRQYVSRFPSDGVTAALEIREITDKKMTGDFTFLDADNTTVAQLIGYEAVMDASLITAFKPYAI